MTTYSQSHCDNPPLSVIRDQPLDSISADEFKSIFRHYPAGVAVITADDGTTPVAMTATSVSSVSANPALFVFSASHASSSTPTLLKASTVVVHFIGVEQLHLAVLASTSGIDRFADKALWSRLPTGEPYFLDAPQWVRGQIQSYTDVGQSTLIVVRAVESADAVCASSPFDEATPLVYHDRAWHALGPHSVIHR
jgi:flavin reductase (DIM6/NTAB) family NADH-FMN oxidoreductase RutF